MSLSKSIIINRSAALIPGKYTVSRVYGSFDLPAIDIIDMFNDTTSIDGLMIKESDILAGDRVTINNGVLMH